MLYFWCITISLTLVALSFILKPLFFYKKNSIEFSNEKLQVKNNYLIATLISIVLPIVSYGLYFHSGHSQVVSSWLTTSVRAEEVKKEIAQYGSREKIITALHTKLMQLPRNADNAKGWYLLGKLYFNEKKFGEAIDSLQIAVSLKPDPEYILELVSVKFFVNKKLSSTDRQLINVLLLQSPNNINATNLLALDAYQQKDFATAVRYWETLIKYFPVDSDDSKALLEMIHQAQSQMPVGANLSSNQSVTVTINISPSLQNEIKPSDILFVYALEEGGSKIPLAAVRIPAKEFPTTVVLDSSTSMMPGRTLQSAEKFYVEARVSKTGNAMPAKGDFVGKSNIITQDSDKKSLSIKIETVF